MAMKSAAGKDSTGLIFMSKQFAGSAVTHSWEN
jgi:hypothetical protein